METAQTTPSADAVVQVPQAQYDSMQSQLARLAQVEQTNDLERALRLIPMGKKNWLFCTTEFGAQQVATIQTLLATCRAHGVDAYTYLVDGAAADQSTPGQRYSGADAEGVG